MQFIPEFPVFAPVSIDMKEELIPFFETLTDGVCEFTFASLYLDSYIYRYNISRVSQKTYIVTGVDPEIIKELHQDVSVSGYENKDQSQKMKSQISASTPCTDGSAFSAHSCRFFTIIGDLPDLGTMKKIILDDHISTCCYLKNLAESPEKSGASLFSQFGMVPELDRDNCDYLYSREDLAGLHGKAFHKKKNLVNAFHSAYFGIIKKIDDSTAGDAIAILNAWKEDRMSNGEDGEGDFLQCSLALQYYKQLSLSGIVLYADGKPAGFSLGEYIAGGTMFCTHFEKGIDSFHGVYQALNNEQAKNLDPAVGLINREQDLGDEGLRQAKMTYRPIGFVNKYKICMHSVSMQNTDAL
jgi:uncharacterized protein